MTSAIARRHNQKPSKAAQILAIATGKHQFCVRLDRLQHSELEALLAEYVYPYELRSLQEFTELSSALQYKYDVLFTYEVCVNELTRLWFPGGSLQFPLDFKSHVHRVDFLSRSVVFQHNETGELTENYECFRAWGRGGGFLKSGRERVLMIRRLPDNGAADQDKLLIELSYEFTKVAKESRWVIGAITVRPIPIRGFCKHLGADAPEAAKEVFRTLRSMFFRTAQHYESRAKSMHTKAQALDRICESVTVP